MFFTRENEDFMTGLRLSVNYSLRHDEKYSVLTVGMYQSWNKIQSWNRSFMFDIDGNYHGYKYIKKYW